MQITDPIADLLTRIRNASTAKHPSVDVPASNLKKAICQILVDEGYIKGMKVTDDGKQGVITLTLKYQENGAPVIDGLKRVSKPGLRIYTNCEDMPKVMKGLGTAIISTSKGVMTDKAARANNVGGEVLAGERRRGLVELHGQHVQPGSARHEQQRYEPRAAAQLQHPRAGSDPGEVRQQHAVGRHRERAGKSIFRSSRPQLGHPATSGYEISPP